jgi:tellurite methyltransferase
MERDEKTLWNRKYSEGSHQSLEPDPFLVTAYAEFIAGAEPGSALDVAGGIGRHALWLAERGWKVKLMDISEVGVDLARENVAARINPKLTNLPSQQLALSGKIDTEVADLRSRHVLGKAKYDLVLVIHYLQRSLFPALISALKPGGFLVYKTYTMEQRRFSGGPSHPMHLLKPNELLRAFTSLRVLHYHETMHGKGVAELVAEKKL